MKQTSNITLSIPNHLIVLMHKYLPKGQMSRFTCEALTKALNELKKQEELKLDAAYEEASKDKERETEAVDWDESDDFSDLADDEDWTWLKK